MSFSPLREANATLDANATQDGCNVSEEDEDDVFHIPPKPSLDMLKKWRKATLVLNASRRFRYTVDLKNKEITSENSELKNGELVSRFRTVTHALRAIQRFKEAGQRHSEGGPIPEGFGIGPSQLVHSMQNQQIDAFQRRYPGGVKNIAQLLKSNLEHGIEDNADDVEKRKEAFGSNKIPPKPGKSFWVFVWEACHDTTLIILMACAVVSFGTEMWSEGPSQGWYDGVSIGAAVVIVIAVTATSDYRQSLQFRDLTDEKKNIPIEVIRGGRRRKLSVFDVVVGDIVYINIGGQIPADGILVSGQSLTIDESSMTGESLPVFKDAKQPFILSGCKVTDGYGKMLVTAVGTHTEWGQVMLTLTEDNGEETPLQVRLNGAATFIGQIGLSVAVLVFIILFIRFFAVEFKNNKKASYAIQEIVRIFAIAVTIVVVAVPEGLPLAVTLTLAYSMRKMMNDNALVRNLAACETMGSATTICSDKTGTLTLNKMSVTKTWVAGQLLDPENVKAIPDDIYQTLLVGICQNSNGSVYTPKDGEVEISGSPTESAALSWGVNIGMNFDEIKRITSVIHVETFNSTKKRAGVVLKLHNGDAQAHWKGAAEMILELSDRWVDAEGSVQAMTQDNAQDLRNQIEGMAAASLRCIAFAYKELDLEHIPVDDEEELRTWEIPYQGLIFVAVIGIKDHVPKVWRFVDTVTEPNAIPAPQLSVDYGQPNDKPTLGSGENSLDVLERRLFSPEDPCRPGVRDAVGRCQAAGVKVRMVTGDSVITAKAIAEECGILTEGGKVVEGCVFRKYSKEELDQELPKIDVMARSSPSDKLLLVKALKERGEVVAVTGDGTNDAPALHDADVGLSMGIAGTEVAKESSDIVILDDNFASIVKVVRWGRSVYANIQKFIQFQLTVNVTALVINFVSSISSGKVPLTAVQLLWVNLIMDTLGALALATEAPTDDLMARTPVGRREPLITNVMWRNLFGQALYQIVVLLTLNYGGKKIFKLENESNPTLVKNTIVFNAFVFCQIFNEVNARRPDRFNIFEGLHTNYLFMGIIFAETVLQFLIVQFLKKFATTHALNWNQWLICIAIGFVSWPLAFLLKLIRVREKPYVSTRRIRLHWRKKKSTLTKQMSGLSGRREIEGSKSNVGETQPTRSPAIGTISVWNTISISTQLCSGSENSSAS